MTAFTGEPGQSSGLEIGDVITQVDAQSVQALIDAWSPYYSASNQAARLSDVARQLPRGSCGESELVISRRGESQTLTVTRRAGIDETPPHDRPGGTFQRLSPEVAYLKLSSIRAEDIDEYIGRAAGTEGLIIDIRNYPAEFVVFSLGSRLVQKPTPFARFTGGGPR